MMNPCHTNAESQRVPPFSLACALAFSAVAVILFLAGPPSLFAAPHRAHATTGQTVRAVSTVRDGSPKGAGLAYSSAITYHTYLPVLDRAATPEPCQSIDGESYSAISVDPPKTDRPAESHPDLNLSIRGYEQTTGYLGLVDVDGSSDPSAPQLAGLFGDNRTPAFSSLHRVYDWDWANSRRGGLISKPPVTLAGFATSTGEVIRVPNSGYTIGSADYSPLGGVALGSGGYETLVLYASADRITLKYTREDNVVRGYTVHIEGICVEPRLLALYELWNTSGRDNLPALSAGQGIGRARGDEIMAAIRDSGSFMEPRSRKDWWRGR